MIYSIGSNFNGLTSIFRDMISGITVSTKVFLTSFETATAVTLAVLAWLGVISSSASTRASGELLATASLMF